MRRALRVTLKLGLGLVVVLLLLVGSALIFVHTDLGHEVVRDKLENQLANTFTGDVRIGKLDGSPFGTYVAREVVIDGPDGKPAIEIGKLSLQLEVTGLVRNRLVLSNLTVEDVSVRAVRQPDGSLSLAHLLRPGPKSSWTVVIRELAVRRGRFELVDRQPVHIDNLELTGALEMAGDRVLASANLTARWIERDVPLRAVLSVKKDAERVTVPAIVAYVGGASVHAANVEIAAGGFGGTGVIRAPVAAISELAPNITLPGDLELAFDARAPQGDANPSQVALTGTLGGDAMSGSVDVWLADKRIAGTLSAPDVRLARLTEGRIPARGGATVELDMRMTDAQLPVGRVAINARGTYQDFPATSLAINANSDGANVRGAVEATNPGLTANVAGQLAFAGEHITITSATVVARSRDLSTASGGVVPLRGSLNVNLVARGPLKPRTELAVTGTIDGKKLVVPAKRGEPRLKIDSLKVAIDARRLPTRPYGTFDLIARDIQGEQLAVRELSIKARDRADGAIHATLRTRMQRDPWLFEADALIRPGAVTTVDLQRHLVRAGAGTEWKGTTGRLAISRDRIELRDLATASKDGALSLAASYQRTGRRAGDVTAKLDAKTLALANVDPKFTGTVDASISMSRVAGVVNAEADVAARDLSIVPPRPKTVPKAAVLATGPSSKPTTPTTPSVPRDAKGSPVDGKSQVAADSGTTPTSPAAASGKKPPAPATTVPRDAKGSPTDGKTELAESSGTQPPAKPAPPKQKRSITKAEIPGRNVAEQVKLDTGGKAPAGVPAGSESAGTAAEKQRRTPGIDAIAKIRVDGSRATVDATATLDKGSTRFALEVSGPSQITDPMAWRGLGRGALKTATIQVSKLDVAAALRTLGVIGTYKGTVDGELKIAAGTPSGELRLRGLSSPELRGLGAVNADFRLATTRDGDIVPTLTARLDGIGSIDAAAELRPPERFFDPAAWRRLGRGAVRHATVKARDLAIDPGRLEQMGIIATARGRVSFDVDLVPDRARIEIAARQLRGSPVSDPVDAEFKATIGDTTNAQLDIRSRGESMFDAATTIPFSLDELIAAPDALRAKPLNGTGRLHVAANRLLAVFGRREITGGKIDGTVLIGGTVGAPTAVATVVATDIKVPPGPGGKPVQTIQRIAIDAVWENRRAVVIVEGRQDRGSLMLAATVSPDALDDATMTLTANQFDLMPVLVFAPGPAGAAAGRLDADLKVRGFDPKKAQVTGTFRLQNGRIPLAPNVGTLRRANIDVAIRDRIVKINLDGRLGGGTVKANGSASLDARGGEIAMTLRRVSPIGVVEPDIDADVTIKLRREQLTWLADIDVRGGKIVVPKKRGEALAPPGAPPDMVFVTGKRMTRLPMEKAPPQQPVLIANVTIAPMKLESEELRGIIRGKIKITADASAVGLVGVIEADRGDLDLFGRRYKVEKAAVRFDGGVDPILDIQLVYDFREVTTMTQVRGRLSKPQLIMKSNPGTYSQGQLLGFLLGGEPTGEPGDNRDRATSVGTSFVANQIGGYVRGALPIDVDVLRYEAATASSSAAITVGTWLRHGLFLAYRRHLEARPDENAGEGEVEYWLSRRVVIEAVVGDRNHDSIDLLWRKRY